MVSSKDPKSSQHDQKYDRLYDPNVMSSFPRNDCICKYNCERQHRTEQGKPKQIQMVCLLSSNWDNRWNNFDFTDLLRQKSTDFQWCIETNQKRIHQMKRTIIRFIIKLYHMALGKGDK